MPVAATEGLYFLNLSYRTHSVTSSCSRLAIVLIDVGGLDVSLCQAAGLIFTEWSIIRVVSHLLVGLSANGVGIRGLILLLRNCPGSARFLFLVVGLDGSPIDCQDLYTRLPAALSIWPHKCSSNQLRCRSRVMSDRFGYGWLPGWSAFSSVSRRILDHLRSLTQPGQILALAL